MINFSISSPNNEKQFCSFNEDEITIGRNSKNSIVLSELEIAPFHAKIYKEDDKLFLVPLDSKNSVLLNKEKIDKPVEIKNGDKFTIGNFTLEISITTDEIEIEKNLEIGITQGIEIEKKDEISLFSSLLFLPTIPKSIEETGISFGTLSDLVLKHIYFSGEISGYRLAHLIGLPFPDIIEPIVNSLKRDKFIEVIGGGALGPISMIYKTTEKGDEALNKILDKNMYAGVAPVSINEYIKGVEKQSIRKEKINKEAIQKKFSDLILEDDIFESIGPAINSGKSLFIYGPAGNGKTAICQRIIRCINEYIWIPYAIEIDGNIIKIFDENNHRPIYKNYEELSLKFDRRWVLCERPLIMVGGELTLEMLDMTYSNDVKYYEAPFQLKANGGILLIDDLGRQRVTPTSLLNRWIVPLENGFDFLSLITGRKIKFPFDVFVVFATNINPQNLLDDAFLRRIRYKLEIKRPTEKQFREILNLVCKNNKIEYNEEGVNYIIELYKRDNRVFNACEPLNLIEGIIDIAYYLGIEPSLTPPLIDRSYKNYFATI